MTKTRNIVLTESQQEDFGKIIAACSQLNRMSEKTLSSVDIELGAMMVRVLLGEDEQTSLLYRAGFANMRFLDTARPLESTADYIFGNNISNYTNTGSVRLPLLIKHIENNEPIELLPLYAEPKRISQSASIRFNQWYLDNRVYVGLGASYNRQNILQLYLLARQEDQTAQTLASGMMANSGVLHGEEQVPFAQSPLEVMAEEIIYEVTESLRIEGILNVTTEEELAQLAQKYKELFIQSVSIENFKLYGEEREYAFNNRFTVLIGDNATGKTTILEALCIVLDYLLPLHIEGAKHTIHTGLKNKFTLQSIHRTISSEENGGIHYQWPSEIIAQSCYGELKYGRPKREMRASRRGYKDLRDAQDRLPLIAYCGVERTRKQEKQKMESHINNNRYDGYVDCLDARTSTYFFKLWFRDLQQRARQSEKARNLLECFVNAVCSCLRSENIKGIQYVYQETKADDGKIDKIDDIVLTKEDPKTGEKRRLLFETLSAGYKVMVGMVANLAYRCIVLNPQLGKDAITGTSGIVLIDEIDMHLHPLWQQHIVEDLMESFPKVQFVATTHSPFIVQSLKKDQVQSLSSVDITKNPSEANIDASIRYMGIDNMYGKDFNDQVTLAKQFFAILRQKEVNEDELRRVHSEYVRRYGDDAVLLARLNLAETVAYERHKG